MINYGEPSHPKPETELLSSCYDFVEKQVSFIELNLPNGLNPKVFIGKVIKAK